MVVAAAEEAVDEADLGPEDEEVDPDHAVEDDDLAPDQTQETQEDDPALDQKSEFWSKIILKKMMNFYYLS